MISVIIRWLGRFLSTGEIMTCQKNNNTKRYKNDRKKKIKPDRRRDLVPYCCNVCFPILPSSVCIYISIFPRLRLRLMAHA
jgi:hypothetical protein